MWGVVASFTALSWYLEAETCWANLISAIKKTAYSTFEHLLDISHLMTMCFLYTIPVNIVPNNVVCVATSCGLDGAGIKSPSG
jgi:hypothetical protein